MDMAFAYGLSKKDRKLIFDCCLTQHGYYVYEIRFDTSSISVSASVIRAGDRVIIRSGAVRVIAEINLLNEVIKTLAPGISLSRFRSYSLREYAAVGLQEYVRAIEEGYLVAEYTVVLLGAKTSLNILSTYNREEALKIQKELCMTLSLPCNGLRREEENTVDSSAVPDRSD